MVFKNSLWVFVILLIASISFIFPIKSHSVPAAPGIHILNQTDGTTFEAKLWGDEWSHGWETREGYTILFDENINKWTYAKHDKDKNLISSTKIVGVDSIPAGILKNIRPTDKSRSRSPLRSF